MRFLFAPLVALAIGNAARPHVPQPEHRPVIVLVHGRGVYGLDSAALRRQWKRDLDSGLSKAGLPALADDDVRLAWYADVLDPASDDKCVGPRDTSEIDFGGIARGFLAGLGAEMERDGEREGRGLLGDLLFVTDPATRCGASRRVEGFMRSIASEGRPVIVVAYSLGSVVTYDMLSALDSASAVRDVRLVTIGSPLAVPALRDLLIGQDVPALTVPASVRSWTNIYDPGDAFAAALGLKARTVEDRAVADSGHADSHEIEHYLRDVETGSAVARALCGSAPAQFGAGCTKL